MSIDLHLSQNCLGCNKLGNWYGSNCKHLTLCLECGKKMVEAKGKCNKCGVTVTRLIREYNVRATPSNDKNYFVGRFVTGLPNFSKKKNADKWNLRKEGLQGRQPTDAMREKYKNKPWLLEDEAGQSQYHGLLEGTQSATYYLLMLQGKEFQAIPAGSWYNFSKVAQYKQLTLEEAEEKIKNRRKNAEGYERWMMKAADNGAAAFGKSEIPEDKDNTGATGRGRKKASAEGDEGNFSDRGEEDDEEEESRKNRLKLNKGGDDDEEGLRGGDHDFDDDDVEKGDDWEHEDIFTDDDEQIGDTEDREDLAEVPAPPEIKQVDDDDTSPVLAPKVKDTPKASEKNPIKPTPTGSARVTPPTSKSSKSKRKSGSDDVKVANVTPSKKVKIEVKIENEIKPSTKAMPIASTGPVTEEEIKAILLQMAPIKTTELVGKFKARLRNKEEKDAFSAILKRISKIKKTNAGNLIVLREASEK
ncbi:hypothetical protein GIB67_013310 [Kingdonia uniflora]|uniref:Transcription initiation factor IIF subunit alpha n=1 Tax=Kingdonia uniflora TaxID=39325 RepID=A0A7J7LQW1_9MAGN|nr:hypothetical protein GIB67_013310 [Kingdonia uniflora]